MFFKLYVTGQTATSVRAIKNLQNILKNELKELYELKIIDVFLMSGSAQRIKIRFDEKEAEQEFMEDIKRAHI